MEDQEKTPPMSPDTQAMPVSPLEPKGVARRRFARVGAGATGVILTLHSQPGMATFSKSLCKSPSGYMSMKPGTSAKPQVSCSSNRSHGYWKTHANEWKSTACIDPAARFGKVFECGRYAALSDVTLMGVIDPSKAVKSIDKNNVAMQCVAALLNARAAQFNGQPTVLPEANVLEIWKQYATNGAYTPGPGLLPWNGPVIASYLESTFR